MPNDRVVNFRVELAGILQHYGVNKLPFADFLARLGQRLAQDVLRRAKVHSLSLVIPVQAV